MHPQLAHPIWPHVLPMHRSLSALLAGGTGFGAALVAACLKNGRPTSRLAALGAAVSACAGYACSQLVLHLCLRSRPALPAPAETPLLLAPQRISASELTADSLWRMVREGKPVILTGMQQVEGMPPLGFDYFREQFGELPVSLAGAQQVSLKGGLAWDAKLSSFIDYIRERAARGLHSVARLHSVYLPEGKEGIFEKPQSVFSEVKHRRGPSGFYIGAKGALVHLHWDPEFNNNFHTVIAGKKRIRLYLTDQSRYLYAVPWWHGLSALSFATGMPDFDHAKFPLFRHAQGYECIVSEGEALFMPAMCWHWMEYLEPSIAMTTAFWTGPLAFTHGTVSFLTHALVHPLVPPRLKTLTLWLCYPGCRASSYMECFTPYLTKYAPDDEMSEVSQMKV